MATQSERDDRPRPKKKKKQQPASRAGLWIGLSIGGGVILFVVVTAVVIIVVAPWNLVAANKKVEQAQDNQNQQGKIGGNVVKEPTSLFGNARRRGDEVALKNEMLQVLIFYDQYAIDVPNPNARKLDGFVESFKRDSNKIYTAIKEEKYYTVNVRARNGSEDILIYESEPYSDGYFCLRANKQFEKVSAQTLKAAGLPTQ
jgi:hypothetical protein